MRHAEDTPTRTPLVDPDRITRNLEREPHDWGKGTGTSAHRVQRTTPGIAPRRAWPRLRQPN